jgi:hypothetical protein
MKHGGQSHQTHLVARTEPNYAPILSKWLATPARERCAHELAPADRPIPASCAPMLERHAGAGPSTPKERTYGPPGGGP